MQSKTPLSSLLAQVEHSANASFAMCGSIAVMVTAGPLLVSDVMAFNGMLKAFRGKRASADPLVLVLIQRGSGAPHADARKLLTNPPAEMRTRATAVTTDFDDYRVATARAVITAMRMVLRFEMAFEFRPNLTNACEWLVAQASRGADAPTARELLSAVDELRASRPVKSAPEDRR